ARNQYAHTRNSPSSYPPQARTDAAGGFKHQELSRDGPRDRGPAHLRSFQGSAAGARHHRGVERFTECREAGGQEGYRGPYLARNQYAHTRNSPSSYPPQARTDAAGGFKHQELSRDGPRDRGPAHLRSFQGSAAGARHHRGVERFTECREAGGQEGYRGPYLA